jgi:glycosyltransferase involved in cell wall biosynthesis
MHRQVLIVTPLIAPGGGPPGYVYNLMKGVNQLDQAGKLNNQFAFMGRRSEDRYKATGEKYRPYSVLSIIVQFLSKWGLNPPRQRRIRNVKMAIVNTDVVVYQGYQDAQLAAYSKTIGKHSVYMPHSPSIMAEEVEMVCRLNNKVPNSKFFSRIRDNERRLIENSDTVVFPSRGSATKYILAFSDLLCKKNIIYLKSGVDINCNNDSCSKINGGQVGKIRIAFAGRYVTHKGYDLFCDAAEIFCMHTPGVEFWSFGAGPLKEENPYVIDMGWRSDLLTVLQEIDIMVVPNRIAYYDLLPLECAALAKPLVMTAVGGSKDQLDDLPDSVACLEPNAEQLAACIQVAVKRLYSDSSWGIRNRQSYEKNFTTEEFAKRWDIAMQKIADHN